MSSVKYRKSEDVPTSEICKRLDQLSDAVTKGHASINREFYMSIPARLENDADFVLSIASDRLMRAEARVEELEQAIFDVLCGEENEVVKKLILNQGCDEVACQYLHTCDHCPIVTTEMENS